MVVIAQDARGNHYVNHHETLVYNRKTFLIFIDVLTPSIMDVFAEVVYPWKRDLKPSLHILYMACCFQLSCIQTFW